MSKPSFFLRMKSLSEKHVGYKDFLNRTGMKLERHTDYSIFNSFVDKNRKYLDFIGVTTDIRGVKHEFEMKFVSSKYIGVIPTFLPNGHQGGDFSIYPNIGKNLFCEELDKEVEEVPNSEVDPRSLFSKLYDLIKIIKAEYLIESMDSIPLKNGMDVCPPMYLEAAKYMDLYADAIRENWRKFGRECHIYNFVKSSTDWSDYSRKCYDPNARLIFRANDNVLSQDHKEWRELRYIFELSAEIIRDPATPVGIRVRYENIIGSLDKRTKHIKAEKPKKIEIHVSDPLAIRLLKEQGKRILDYRSTMCIAWRIDVATLFERYVQYILEIAFRSYGGTVISNQKFMGIGNVPRWGLKYLEPDILVKLENGCVVVCDAKYKANMFVSENSEILHETHRHDLHQVIAYSAFSPEKNKTVILVYPANAVSMKEFGYESGMTGISNHVYLMGIPFDTKDIEDTINNVKQCISSISALSNDVALVEYDNNEEIGPITLQSTEMTNAGKPGDDSSKRNSNIISFNGKLYSMRNLARDLVEDYVKKNPSITYNELRTAFDIVLKFNNKPLIQLESLVSESEKKYNRFYWKTPFHLADGNVIVVNTQWQRADLEDFQTIAAKLGYDFTIQA